MKKINHIGVVPRGLLAAGIAVFMLVGGVFGQSLINVDTGPGSKSGSAVVGFGGDFWNQYYPDDGNGGLFSDGVLVPLYDSTNSATGAGLLLFNVDSQGNTGWGDEMFDWYLAATGTNLLIYVTNAPAGVYDLYLYGHGSSDSDNSIFEVTSMASYLGRKQTGTYYEWNDSSMSWYEDQNYVRYGQVAMSLGGNLLIEVRPNAAGKAIVNGLQLKSVAIPAGDWDGDGLANATEIQTLGTDPQSADTDGDGIHDGQEQSDSTDPNDPWSLTEKMLTLWSFDGSPWTGAGGQSPTVTANLAAVSGVTNGAVELESAAGAAAKLVYHRVESGASINATMNRGALRFLFRPNWSTTSGGPGSVARLVDLGLPSAGTNDGTWTLYVTADGAAIKFVTRAFGGSREHLSAAISWTAGQWYELVLDYDPSASELFVNGSSAATGTGVTDFIKPGDLSIGGDGSDGPLGAPQWLDDPGFSDPNSNWEWLDSIGDYAWGRWEGTWYEDWESSNPNSYYRDVYDYDWNYVYDGYGYWEGYPTGDNGSARGSFDEFATFNHPLNGGGGPPPSPLPSVDFSPASGATVPTSVTLSVTNHPGATIYYTTNGSAPTISSLVYAAPLSLTAATTVRAKAVEAGFADSVVTSAAYALPVLPAVAFAPGDGALLPATVTLSTPGHSGAMIRYTADGSVPGGQSPEYLAPIALGTNAAQWSGNVVPTMNDEDEDGHLVRQSSGSGWEAFGSDDAQYWVADTSGPEWLEFEFPTERVISRYTLKTPPESEGESWALPGSGPRDFRFEAWDGAAWVTLDERLGEFGWKDVETRAYTVSTNGTYRRYRLYVFAGTAGKSNPAGRIVVGKLAMEESTALLGAFAEQAGHVSAGVTLARYHGPAPELPPTIVDASTLVTVALGDTLDLRVRASGSAPFTYQWFFNGEAIADTPGQGVISGGAAQTLTIANVGSDDMGAYHVRVSNLHGTVDSPTAAVAIGNGGQVAGGGSGNGGSGGGGSGGGTGGGSGGLSAMISYQPQLIDFSSCPSGNSGYQPPTCTPAPANGCISGGLCAVPSASTGQKTGGPLFAPNSNMPPAPRSFAGSGITVPYSASSVGVNNFDVVTGSAYREIVDLSLHGGVGQHHLEFIRHNDTSVINFGPVLGEVAGWRHNYQWYVRYSWDLTWCGAGGLIVGIQTPQGQFFDFNLSAVLTPLYDAAVANGEESPSITNLIHQAYNSPDALIDEEGRRYVRFGQVQAYISVDSSANPLFEVRSYDLTNVVLHFPTGWKYEFDMPEIINGVVRTSVFDQFTDPHGLDYLVEVNTNTFVPTRITEPAGRWLGIDYGADGHVSRVEASDRRFVTYGYTTVTNEYAEEIPLLTEVDYQNGTKAEYAYYDAVGTGDIRYKLAVMDDPKLTGAGANIQYLYGNANGRGMVVGEMNPVTGRLLANIVDVEHTFQNETIDYFTVVDAAGVSNVYRADVTAAFEITRDGVQTHHRSPPSPLHVEDFEHEYLTVTDALGRKQVSVMTTNHVPLEITRLDPQGNIVHREGWSRDAYGFPLAHTNANGGVTTYLRDTNHLVVRVTYPDNSTEGFAYNALRQVIHQTNQLGGVTQFEYDSTGQLTNTINAVGGTLAHTYDAAGRMASVTDGRGNTTTYGYDNAERRNVTVFADGNSTGTAYDKYSNKTHQTNELGKVWSWTYNELNQQSTATDPLDRTSMFLYSLNPNCCGGSSGVGQSPSQIVSPSGRETRIEYNADGKQTAIIVAYGTSEAATNRFEYDLVGRMTNRIDALGNEYHTTYDALDRPVTQTDPLFNTTVSFYDPLGNSTGLLRPDNVATTNHYDAMNRLTVSLDAAGNTNTFSYDNAGNLLSLTDARGNTHSYLYDLGGRKRVMTYPGGSTEQWSYNAVGAVEYYTNRAGHVRTSAFDNRNRETNYVWNDGLTPSVTRIYDPVGRLSTLNSSLSQLSYSYDDANQLLSETQAITGQSPQTLAYTYTDDGQRHTLTYPNGTIVTNEYTQMGLLQSLTLSGATNALATYGYDALGRRTSRAYDNGTASLYTYTYTSNSQVAQISHTNGAGVFASFEYGYNNLGHRLYEKRADGLGDAYQYDVLGQVTNVQYEAYDVDTNPQFASRNVGYNYDPNGNREAVIDNGVTDTYVANVLNHYTNITLSGGWAGLPTYDGNGNLVAALGTTNTYDAQNRLLSSENVTNRMVFEYDAKNRCVRREVFAHTNATWSFSHAYLLYYDGWNLVEERATNNAAICHYVHGANTDEILVRIGAADPVYRYENALGSVTALAATTGDVVETYQYDIYGKASISNASGAAVASTAFQNRFLFTGREWLVDVSLYDYRNRVYSTELGRFLQNDLIGFLAGDLSLMRYVANDPINWRDSYGLTKGGKQNPCPSGWDGASIEEIDRKIEELKERERNGDKRGRKFREKLEGWRKIRKSQKSYRNKFGRSLGLAGGLLLTAASLQAQIVNTHSNIYQIRMMMDAGVFVDIGGPIQDYVDFVRSANAGDTALADLDAAIAAASDGGAGSLAIWAAFQDELSDW